MPAFSARSAARAVGALHAQLALVASCVSRTPLVLRSLDKIEYEITFPRPQLSVRLAIVPPTLCIVRHSVTVLRDEQSGLWVPHTVGYRYAVQNERGNADELPKDIIAFDWHPDGRSAVLTPHVHVHSEGTRLSRKHHIPTGPGLRLASAVRFLIAELGVAPARDDWESVLTVNERAEG